VTPLARRESLSSRDAPATHPYRWLHRPLHPVPRAQAAFGPEWVHEVKHDGYRLIVRRDGEAVRLFTRRGHDWTDRYPAITASYKSGPSWDWIKVKNPDSPAMRRAREHFAQ
jgi:ATP-dependent DNA ligase